MKVLLVLEGGEVWDTIAEDIEEYDLEKPFAQSELIQATATAIAAAKRAGHDK